MKNWVEINGIFYNLDNYRLITVNENNGKYRLDAYAIDDTDCFLGCISEKNLSFSTEEEAREYLRNKLNGE